MGSFTPSVVTAVPPTLLPGDPEQTPGAYELFRFFRARPRGVNVYMFKVGSPSEAALIAAGGTRVTEDDPIARYDANGNVTTNGWEDIELVFWGGHAAVEVTAAQQAALEAEGYTVTP